MSRVRQIQDSAWDAEVRRDLDELIAHFHTDAVFHPAGGAPQRGHEAIRAMTEEFYAAYPELAIEVRNEWNRGDSAGVFEFRARIADNDGVEFTLDGVCAVEIDGDLITSVRYYEDAPVRVD